jgi:hypothetical protein
LDPDAIGEMLDILNKNQSLIESDIASLVFHMNGGLDFDDAYLLTADQRRMMAIMIQKHYDAQNPKKQSQL